jgi:diketogulonate reductase-like aldo/keto reductase
MERVSEHSATVEAAPTAREMPMLGLGTWKNEDPEACTNAVATALDAGYRHIDTAQAYGNEEHVGRGIERADVPREDVFLATKVWNENLGYDDVLDSTETSLRKLGVDSVDLLYVHWPAGAYDPEDTFRAFDELYDDGKIDRIGISNFPPEYVNDAIDHTDNPIFANQVEIHPLLPQPELREHCIDHGIEVVAYSPLARGGVFEAPELTEIAEKHGVSEARVSLAWLREKGITAIPKATSEAHVRDNWASLNLDLDTEDVEAIDAIDRTDRRLDPSFAPW